jgi:hypothetical protein
MRSAAPPSRRSVGGCDSGMTPDSKADRLEAAVKELTRPTTDQFPRPWMTTLTAPWEARVFTVGMNQRNPFPLEQVGGHERYLDALFNRGPETCRQLYDRIVGEPSPTRRNTDGLIRKLANHGVTDVLETNVVCYSTPMSAHLRHALHLSGAAKGSELFAVLLEVIKPSVLIAHGAGTAKKLGRTLNRRLPKPPAHPNDPVQARLGDLVVFIVPSLAPPAYNKWSSWAQDHLDKVAESVADQLSRA